MLMRMYLTHASTGVGSKNKGISSTCVEEKQTGAKLSAFSSLRACVLKALCVSQDVLPFPKVQT